MIRLSVISYPYQEESSPVKDSLWRAVTDLFLVRPDTKLVCMEFRSAT